jgi:hypothetical protein
MDVRNLFNDKLLASLWTILAYKGRAVKLNLRPKADLQRLVPKTMARR